jgi:hypothetical protein
MTAEKARRIVDEVAWGQVETEPTITIHVALTPAQLVALCKHVDRIIEADQRKANIDPDELDAIEALRDAWPYRWRERPP